MTRQDRQSGLILHHVRPARSQEGSDAKLDGRVVVAGFVRLGRFVVVRLSVVKIIIFRGIVSSILQVFPERFVRLFDAFQARRGSCDADNFRGSAVIRARRSRSLLFPSRRRSNGNFLEPLLLLGGLHEGQHNEILRHREGDALRWLGRLGPLPLHPMAGRAGVLQLVRGIAGVRPARKGSVPGGHRLGFRNARCSRRRGPCPVGRRSAVRAAAVFGLHEQGGSAFHALIEPLRARGADVGVAAGEDHRRPVLGVECLEAYYAVEGERGGAAAERRAHGWVGG
mmetsp:Transcript_614/g.1435  ORF Transcript_614/g.1435 Transcript_614/m.1435 type:complete len:283 (-) Transcript_614:30-878(-)